MEWSFTTKSPSSSHQLLSFKVKSEDGVSQKTGKEFMTMSNAQGFIEKKFSGIPPSSSPSHHKAFLPSPGGLNGLSASTMNHIVSPCNPAVDFTGIRTDCKRVPTQLTIFYDGQVCVYDDISPEKAQAIMLLAGNGHSMANKMETQTLIRSTLANPVNSISSVQVENQQKSAANNVSTHFQREISTSSITMVAVPQARKASLARFLEKRKERVLNAAPYMNKHSL